MALAGLVVVTALTACRELLVAPAHPGPAGLAIAIAGPPAGAAATGAATAAEVFDRADAVRVWLLRGEGEVVVDVTRSFSAGGGDARVRVEVDLEGERETLQLELSLSFEGQPLFLASRSVVLEAGATTETEVTLQPVPARVEVPAGPLLLESLGEQVQLSGSVVFATGDPVPGASPSWSTLDPGVASVTPAGLVTALAEGEARVVGAFQDLSATVVVRVRQAVASIQFIQGEGQTNYPGEPHPVSPQVKVADANGVGVAGVEVFLTANMGGTISDPLVVTDAAGIATAETWMLGDHGPNTLTADVDGLPTATLTVHTLDPCERVRPIALGDMVSGTFPARRSCVTPTGRHGEFWELELAAGGVFAATITSDDFGPFIGTTMPGGFVTDVQLSGASVGPAPSGQVRLEHAYPPGTYWLLPATRSDPPEPPVGSYTLSVEPLTEPQVGCSSVLTAVKHGSVVYGNITSDDCKDQSSFDSATVTRWWDGYSVHLYPGQSVTARVTADFPVRLSRWSGGTFQEGAFTVAPGDTGSITHTAAVRSFHFFYVYSDEHEGTGSYTMRFELTGLE